jgi:2-polyprenyl-6-methoxyphenol hydroxylase-like FAD-dependent oxidoreductase
VRGVREKTPRGELDFHADLVIGADGRHSITQARAGLEQQDFGVPIDALWMRISKKQDDPEQSFGFFQHGRLLVLIDRSDYWQAGFVIPKGGFEEISARPIGISSSDRQLRRIFARPRMRAGRVVQNQIAHSPDQSVTRVVP